MPLADILSQREAEAFGGKVVGQQEGIKGTEIATRSEVIIQRARKEDEEKECGSKGLRTFGRRVCYVPGKGPSSCLCCGAVQQGTQQGANVAGIVMLLRWRGMNERLLLNEREKEKERERERESERMGRVDNGTMNAGNCAAFVHAIKEKNWKCAPDLLACACFAPAD